MAILFQPDVGLHTPRPLAIAALVASLVAPLWLNGAALAQAGAGPGVTLPAAPAPAAAPLPPPGWSSTEVETELARCAQLLRDVDVVARHLQPIKEHECGAPAPLELISVGKSPQVSFSPPVIVTCDLAAALARFVKSDVQPLARKYLGAEIVRIDTMSSYSCRTAYGRKNSRLSEHGHANAVDLRSFTTAKGANAVVLDDWGPTGRDIAEQVAAAKKLEAERAVQTARVPQAPAGVATGSVAVPGVAVGAWPRPAIATGTRTGPAIGLQSPSTGGVGIGFSSGTPSHLGGPKDQGAAAGPEAGTTAKTVFLRALHDSACKSFGTTLGPEANSAHRNHFHLDMAERKTKLICE